MVRHNQIRFDPLAQKDDCIKRESDVTWFMPSYQVKTATFMSLKRQEVDSQHKAINLDDLTSFTHDNAFTWSKGISEEMRDVRKTDIFGIFIELDFDLIRSERTYYTFIDWLSDIGGVQSILTSFAGVLISIVKHDRIANFLASNLYKIRNSDESSQDSDGATDGSSHHQILKPPRISNIGNFILDGLLCDCVRRFVHKR